MNRFLISSILVLFFSCVDEVSQPKYLRWVGDIPSDLNQDEASFQLCNAEDDVRQYFHFGKGFPFKGEKKKLLEIFEKKFIPLKSDQSGWIRIRFIVNCDGHAGRYRLIGSDKNYKEQVFDDSIKDQLVSVLKSIDGWEQLKHDDQEKDYYFYLVFKLENGHIKEILP